MFQVVVSARQKTLVARVASVQEEHLTKKDAVAAAIAALKKPTTTAPALTRSGMSGRSAFAGRRLQQQTCNMEVDVDFYGGDLYRGRKRLSTSPEDCCARCYANSTCFAWTFVPSTIDGELANYYGCWMKKASGWERRAGITGLVSGVIDPA